MKKETRALIAKFNLNQKVSVINTFTTPMPQPKFQKITRFRIWKSILILMMKKVNAIALVGYYY